MEEENMVQDESSSQEYEGEGQYSEEEVDRIADTAIEAIQDILKYFNVGEVTIEEYEGDEGELILDITGDDLAVLIGRHGRTLGNAFGAIIRVGEPLVVVGKKCLRGIVFAFNNEVEFSSLHVAAGQSLFNLNAVIRSAGLVVVGKRYPALRINNLSF